MSGCGGGSSGDGEDDNGGDSSTDVTTSSHSCGKEDNHDRYAGRDCAASGCHATNKTMSYSGSAPVGGAVVVIETDGTTYNLKVNGDGNFCLRTKYGGNPGGGYTAVYGTTMVTRPTNGSCNTDGCHDSNLPIY